MRLYLINPSNPLVCITSDNANRLNRFRIWRPLGLMILAGLTPPEWEITIIDENLKIPDYSAMPRPDLVGLTAFTSQVNRAYEVSAYFRNLGVPVVMGGIHASMCMEEALERVDTVVKGEAEGVWAQVLYDAQNGGMKRSYVGEQAEMTESPPARHDLLPSGYFYGSIQTTRGCPLNCSFCSVSAFNGRGYRHRPIENVVEEFKSIREKNVLIVDDNLIGTRAEHIDRAKDLFRALIRANLRKTWIGQTTINVADDTELLRLAARAGCRGLFIGFESPTPEGLAEIGKRFNLKNNRDFKASVRRIQKFGILVVGSFIIGLDTDEHGIGRRIAEAANRYGVDILNTLFLTPLPGTRLWKRLVSEGRIAANVFPEDWRYYTLTLPVAKYRNLSCADMAREMDICDRTFYSLPRILRRVFSCILHGHKLFTMLVSNLSYRYNIRLARRMQREYDLSRTQASEARQKQPVLL
ncbi:MAG: B12-binding domain-containing radical SAM protein [Planctomycetota bacterium]|nr:MAG: B12-binding domain-containing radical SAM protein [Planctomycetota bacterium]